MAIANLVANEIGVSLLPDWAPMWKAGLPIERIELPGRAPLRKVGLIWGKHGPRVSLIKKILETSKALTAKTTSLK
jgi:DNA-binding transcriptional LysR family regulator